MRAVRIDSSERSVAEVDLPAGWSLKEWLGTKRVQQLPVAGDHVLIVPLAPPDPEVDNAYFRMTAQGFERALLVGGQPDDWKPATVDLEAVRTMVAWIEPY